MTEKAAVEVPSPVSGRIVSLTGAPGDMVPVGAELIVFDIDAGDDELAEPSPAVAASATGDTGTDLASTTVRAARPLPRARRQLRALPGPRKER